MMKRKGMDLGYRTLFSLCMIGSLVFASPVQSRNEFKLKLGARGEICLRCHETVKKTVKSRFVHPLVKKGDCVGCHDPHTSSHKGLLTEAGTKLCQSCHQELLPENALSAHEIVVQGKCAQCHEVHGADNNFILKESGNALCFDCHKAMSGDLAELRFKHRSVDRGRGCLNCHSPHASAESNHLLQTVVPSLCKRCHKTDKLTFTRKHMNYPVADSNCTSCHNPHGSNSRGIVFDVAHSAVVERRCTECHRGPASLETKKQTTRLCQGCHRDMTDKIFNKNRVHWPLLDTAACLNCHNPHATKQDKLVQGSIVNVCGKCHADTVQLQQAAKSKSKDERLCEPVKTGDCITCHSPHSADNILLVSEKSISFDLCGGCHEWQTHSTHPIGEKAVDQRNKNLTLDCLSCHTGCGTKDNPFMLTFGTTYELCIQCHVDMKR